MFVMLAVFIVLQLTENTTSSIMLLIIPLLDLIILKVFSNHNCSVCFSSDSIRKVFAVSLLV